MPAPDFVALCLVAAGVAFLVGAMATLYNELRVRKPIMKQLDELVAADAAVEEKIKALPEAIADVLKPILAKESAAINVKIDEAGASFAGGDSSQIHTLVENAKARTNELNDLPDKIAQALTPSLNALADGVSAPKGASPVANTDAPPKPELTTPPPTSDASAAAPPGAIVATGDSATATVTLNGGDSPPLTGQAVLSRVGDGAPVESSSVQQST